MLKMLIKREVYAPSQTLDDEQKKIINAVVPTDLDAEELVALAKLMGARSGTLTPIPQLVIEAIQKIRPEGKKRPMVRPKAPVPSQAKAPAPKPQRARPAPSYLVIDLEGYVFDHAKIDSNTRSVTLPEIAKIQGVTLQRVAASVAILIDGADNVALVRATFRVTAMASATPRIFNDGTPVRNEEVITVSVAVPPARS